MCPALFIHTELPAVDCEVVLKNILPCLCSTWQRNLSIRFISPLSRHGQGYHKPTLQVRKMKQTFKDFFMYFQNNNRGRKILCCAEVSITETSKLLSLDYCNTRLLQNNSLLSRQVLTCKAEQTTEPISTTIATSYSAVQIHSSSTRLQVSSYLGVREKTLLQSCCSSCLPWG